MKLLTTAIAFTLGGTFFLTTTAHAILILTPLTPGVLSPASATNPLNADQVEAIVGYAGDLTEVYKDEITAEVGAFADSYTTVYSNSNGNATITYDGAPDPFITGSPIYIAAKDGNNIPYSYIWDISGWDGVMEIQMQDLWPDSGSISHVTIFTGNRTSVPDGGATVALFGLALGGISFGRRLFSKSR